jgi:hypothetical protein
VKLEWEIKEGKIVPISKIWSTQIKNVAEKKTLMSENKLGKFPKCPKVDKKLTRKNFHVFFTQLTKVEIYFEKHLLILILIFRVGF